MRPDRVNDMLEAIANENAFTFVTVLKHQINARQLTNFIDRIILESNSRMGRFLAGEITSANHYATSTSAGSSSGENLYRQVSRSIRIFFVSTLPYHI